MADMAGSLSELAQRGYHVLHDVQVGDEAIAHLVIGPSGVFAVEEGPKPTGRMLESIRHAAQRAAQTVAPGEVDVVPVFIAPSEAGGLNHGVLVVDDLVAALDDRPTVFSDKQCYGLAARAKVMLAAAAPAAPTRLEKVKPPSRLPAIAFTLLVFLAFAAAVAAFANSVLGGA